jgi:predicted transposase YdaD
LKPREAAELKALLAQETNREVHAMELTWADRLRAEGWNTGRTEGRTEGRKEGEQEGRRRERERAVRALRPLLLDLLGDRFGPLSEDVRRRVEAIDSVERLTRLARKGLTALSLEEMGLG